MTPIESPGRDAPPQIGNRSRTNLRVITDMQEAKENVYNLLDKLNPMLDNEIEDVPQIYVEVNSD